MDAWAVYVAGFFDGEGSVSIARVRSGNYSDYHKMVVAVSQRAKYGAVLNRIQEAFGGTVRIAKQKHRIADRWAEQAAWQLQDKASMRRFFTAIQPYAIVKARQIELGLEFLDSFGAATRLRDDLGRVRGRSVSTEIIEHREQIRLALREANELGPPRVKPSVLPPLDVQARPVADLTANAATIMRGTKHPGARLTDESVREIRATYAAGGTSQTTLAKRYGVSVMLINGIVRRKRWAHVPDILPKGD